MATKRMSKCFLCGTEYEVCKLCKNVYAHTPWRMMCDSARHFGIYNIVLELRRGVLKPDEALEQFERINLTIDEVKTFVPSVQEVLLPIMEQPRLAMEINDETDQAEVEEEHVEQVANKKKAQRSKK